MTATAAMAGAGEAVLRQLASLAVLSEGRDVRQRQALVELVIGPTCHVSYLSQLFDILCSLVQQLVSANGVPAACRQPGLAMPSTRSASP